VKIVLFLIFHKIKEKSGENIMVYFIDHKVVKGNEKIPGDYL